MKSLKDKLSKLQKKSISDMDTSSLLEIKEQKSQEPVIEQLSTDDDGFIVPSSVDDYIQQKVSQEDKQVVLPIQRAIQQANQRATQQTTQQSTQLQQLKDTVDDSFSIKAVSKSLSTLKNIVLASVNAENESKPQEQQKKPKSKKNKFKDIIVDLSEELKNDAEEIVEEIKKEYKKKSKKDIPTDVDLVELVPQIEEVLKDIPGTEDLDFSDFEVVNTSSKKGYTKTVVGFKKDTPKELSEIATIARKVSGNLIKPRTMHLMNIDNINKTQLKDKQFKLSVRSYVFKPDHTKMKVSKFNRFIISLHEDFETSNQVYVYMQESRKKFVTKLDIDVEFLGKLIYSFYNEGFDITTKRLQFKNTQNPLLRLVTDIVKSKEFKVKPFKVDEESQTVKGLKIKSTTGINEWLTVIVRESNMVGLYDLYATADFDESWKIKINNGFKKNATNGFDLAYLHTDEFISKLVKFWNNKIETFKTAGLDLEDKDTVESMLINKLKHRNLRTAFIDLLDTQEENPDLNLEITQTYSQLETKKLLELGKQEDYNAELIIGKTDKLEFFMISYFANLIVGGDKRKGSEFITSKEYYEKYGVKDTRDYEERRNTILKRGEKERNYNARPYMFKLEYKLKSGKEKELIAATFDELKEKTGFLTDSPK